MSSGMRSLGMPSARQDDREVCGLKSPFRKNLPQNGWGFHLAHVCAV